MPVAYVTVPQLRDALSPDEVSAADESSAAILPDVKLAEAIVDAQSEVDSRLAGGYTVPFTTPPPMVVTITRDIAAYLATLTYYRGQPLDPTNPVVLRYARAEQLLAAAARGSLELEPGDAPDETAAAHATVVNPYDGNLFTPDDFALVKVPGGSSRSTSWGDGGPWGR